MRNLQVCIAKWWTLRGHEVGSWRRMVTLDLKFPERPIEEPHSLVHIRLADIQHGRKSDDVAVQTALADQQSVLARAFKKLRSRLWGRFLCFAILHEFEPQHKTLAAYVADYRIFLLEFIELAAEIVAHLLRVIEKFFLFDEFDRRFCRHRRHRISAERGNRQALKRCG